MELPESSSQSQQPVIVLRADPLQSCRRQAREDCSSYSLLTSALDGRALPLWKSAGTHWIRGWVGLRAGLGTETRGKILSLCRGSNPGRLVCSQTLLPLCSVSLEPTPRTVLKDPFQCPRTFEVISSLWVFQWKLCAFFIFICLLHTGRIILLPLTIPSNFRWGTNKATSVGARSASFRDQYLNRWHLPPASEEVC
jgi:hypothetical protein